MSLNLQPFEPQRDEARVPTALLVQVLSALQAQGSAQSETVDKLKQLLRYPRWELHGRRWFQRGPGNTYHVVRVYENGELVYTSPRSYGYGDSYITTAFEWLVASGRLPAKERGHYSTIDLRETFGGDYSVEDVSRERDL